MLAEVWTEEDDQILDEIQRRAPPALDTEGAGVSFLLDTNILSHHLRSARA